MNPEIQYLIHDLIRETIRSAQRERQCEDGNYYLPLLSDVVEDYHVRQMRDHLLKAIEEELSAAG